jgi:regulator of PEP synthase PpsR (kinase-PPPase family)
MKKRKTERIALISDGTCDTAENYVRAILAQFKRSDAEMLRFPKIRNDAELMRALDKLEPPYLLAYTFAEEKLRKLIWSESKKRGLFGVDIFYPTIDLFSEFLRSNPTQDMGALHSTQAVNYFERVEAIEYTVKHDDGMRQDDLTDAEIILTGASRTSKTPTSMYLAHKGYRVANVPLVPGIEPPGGLQIANESGVPIFLLTIEPTHLARIRRSRFDRLGAAPNQSDTYVDLSTISEELKNARALARRHQWVVIDVTNKAVEETASEILLLVSSKQP